MCVAAEGKAAAEVARREQAFAEEEQAAAVCVAAEEKAAAEVAQSEQAFAEKETTAEVAQPGQIFLRRRLKEKQRKKEHRFKKKAQLEKLRGNKNGGDICWDRAQVDGKSEAA